MKSHKLTIDIAAVTHFRNRMAPHNRALADRQSDIIDGDIRQQRERIDDSIYQTVTASRARGGRSR
jgi:hypothetical protein